MTALKHMASLRGNLKKRVLGLSLEKRPETLEERPGEESDFPRSALTGLLNGTRCNAVPIHKLIF